MILVDTSVLIDALRKPDPKIQQLFIVHQAAICGVSRAEVLCGGRDAAHYPSLAAALALFPQIGIPDSSWDSLGQTLFLLRSNGITVPFPDALIATVAIENNLELWTRDTQFAMIQKVLPALRLFQEPP